MIYITIIIEGTARLFLYHVWKLHSLLNHVALDRGPQFVVLFTRELYSLLRVKIISFIIWYPQSDEQIEQVNQELDQYLQIFVNEQQSDQHDLLSIVEFQHNNYKYSLIQQPPFLLNTEQLLQIGFKPHQYKSKLKSVSKFIEIMKSTLEKAKSAIQKSQDNMTKYCN